MTEAWAYSSNQFFEIDGFSELSDTKQKITRMILNENSICDTETDKAHL